MPKILLLSGLNGFEIRASLNSENECYIEITDAEIGSLKYECIMLNKEDTMHLIHGLEEIYKKM